MFFSPDLVNVFEVFLSQLLMYPNLADPLNGEAVALLMKDRTAFEQRVKGRVFLDFSPPDHMIAFIGTWQTQMCHLKLSAFYPPFRIISCGHCLLQ